MQFRCRVTPLLGVLSLVTAKRQAHELDEVVNLNDYKRADLCKNEVVEDGCSRLRVLQEGDADETTLLTAVQLALSAKSMSSFWEAIGLHEDSVDCHRLCLEVVKYIGENGVLPAENDYACYNVGMETICDAYVGDDILHTFGPSEDKDIPDFHDDEVMKKIAKEVSHAAGAANSSSSSFLQRAVALADLHADNVAYSNWEAAERIANFFHIYPVQHPEQNPHPEEAEEGQAEEGVPQPIGRAREEDELADGLLEVSKREGELGGVPANMGRWPAGSKHNTQRKLAEAKVYVNAAIEHFEHRATCKQMDRWFGTDTYNNEENRREILRIMNSVRHMLGNIEVFPIGSKCTPNTFAYVFPRAYTCNGKSELANTPCTTLRGKYVFYVCDLFFNRPSEQIETLVHEGSHHATAYTDDVEYGGQKAYGRYACQRLAIGDDVKARKNADSFCYYIQDIATQLGTHGSTSSSGCGGRTKSHHLAYHIRMANLN